MRFPGLFLLFVIHAVSWLNLPGQLPDSVYILTGIVYDELYQPVAATHVINMNTHSGDVADSLGIFRLPVHSSDTLLVRNIAFLDTLVPVSLMGESRIIRIQRKHYLLQEARIFEWGSSYGDFRRAIVGMPDQQTLGKTMGLPTQDPDYIPLEMDEAAIKSPLLLVTSPVSFFYYNLSKHARSARKVFWLKKNREKHTRFDAVMSEENLRGITGLSGDGLLKFRTYLYQNMVCGINCTELQIYEEIYNLWEVYRLLN